MCTLVPPGAVAPAYSWVRVCACLYVHACLCVYGCAHWCLLGLWSLHAGVCVCLVRTYMCKHMCVFTWMCTLVPPWAMEPACRCVHVPVRVCMCMQACVYKSVCVSVPPGALASWCVCVCLYLYVRRVCGHAHECLSTRVRVCVHAQQCLQVTRVSHAHRCWSVHVYTQRCAYNALNAQCCVWQCEEIVALSLCLQHYSSQISGPWHGCPH